MEKPFKVNNFDLIRIFAATQVLITHSIIHLQIKIPHYLLLFLNKFPGVPIFFLVSGYLISASYERTNNLKSYIQNRCLRIYPGLIVCVLVTIVALSFMGFNFFNLEAIPWLFCQVVGLIYTPKFLSGFGFGSYNGSLWTIPVELQFYFVLPVIYFFLKATRKKHVWFFLIFCLFLIISYIILQKFPNEQEDGKEPLAQKLLRYSFIPHFFIFLLGANMQRLNLYKSPLIYGKGLIWLTIYLVFSFLVPDWPINFFLERILLGFCILSIAYTLPYLSNKLLKGNDISYGVYIYHGLILSIFFQLKMFYKIEYLLLIFLASYILGYLSWIFIEKTFIKKKKQTIHAVVS